MCQSWTRATLWSGVAMIMIRRNICFARFIVNAIFDITDSGAFAPCRLSDEQLCRIHFGCRLSICLLHEASLHSETMALRYVSVVLLVGLAHKGASGDGPTSSNLRGATEPTQTEIPEAEDSTEMPDMSGLPEHLGPYEEEPSSADANEPKPSMQNWNVGSGIRRGIRASAVLTKQVIGAMISRVYGVASCKIRVATPSVVQLPIPAFVVGKVLLRATCRIQRTLLSALLGGRHMVVMIVAVVLVAHGMTMTTIMIAVVVAIRVAVAAGTYILAGTRAPFANHIMVGAFARRTTSFIAATITGTTLNATVHTMIVVRGVRCFLLGFMD